MFDRRGPSLAELAQQALSSTERGYDLLAPRFEHTPFRTPDAIIRRALDLAGPPDPAVGLDLCCGTGAALAQLRERCHERVIGVDRSAGMLGVARARLEKGSGVPAELLRGDVRALELDSSADVACSFGAWGHILPPEQPRVLRAVYRALRPGGRFITVSSPHPRPWQPSWWLSRTFNGAMHVRNLVIQPPFIMFYLQFTLERAIPALRAAGFDVHLHAEVFGARWPRLCVLEARRLR